jgi:hypothetical protein
MRIAQFDVGLEGVFAKGDDSDPFEHQRGRWDPTGEIEGWRPDTHGQGRYDRPADVAQIPVYRQPPPSMNDYAPPTPSNEVPSGEFNYEI